MSQQEHVQSISSDDSGIDEKIRKRREVKITPEMEPHLDRCGTHCLKCGTKTKDIDCIIAQVASRKKLGGTRDAIKSKCAYCNANKNKFVTKIKETVVEENEPIVEIVKSKRGRKPKLAVA